jgi:SNF2 family DNA or RNA helicase
METSCSPLLFDTGITLTTASRVYLMEPSLDPAAEVQAADGRIHRLGQTKQVQVKKLVFCNSIESNIVVFSPKLHTE